MIVALVLLEIIAVVCGFIAKIGMSNKKYYYWISIVINMVVCYIIDTVYCYTPVLVTLWKKIKGKFIEALSIVLITFWRQNTDVSRLGTLDMLFYCLLLGKKF